MKANDSISFGKHLEKTPDQESPAKPLNKNTVRKKGWATERVHENRTKKGGDVCQKDLNFVPGP
jgi:hypothetical protein